MLRVLILIYAVIVSLQKCTVCTKARPKSHGAPVQCTKGKCPKAFHVSCARDGGSGSDQGIMFTVVGEVEKEVIFSDGSPSHQHQALLQPTPIPTTATTTVPVVNPPINDQMPVDHPAPTSISEEGVGAVGAIDSAAPNDNDPSVFKTVKKLEVQILCTQHNPVRFVLFLFCLCFFLLTIYTPFSPLFVFFVALLCAALFFPVLKAVAAQKRANKNEKIRNDLLALPSMSRIKIRVSAGVFEVSLIRVIEETSTVEVLWDRGLKKEFKWGSVVFGFTDGPVLQKPSDIAPPEPERTAHQQHQPVFSAPLLSMFFLPFWPLSVPPLIFDTDCGLSLFYRCSAGRSTCHYFPICVGGYGKSAVLCFGGGVPREYVCVFCLGSRQGGCQ